MTELSDGERIFDDMLRHFDTIPDRDRQIDRPRDNNLYVLYIASHGKIVNRNLLSEKHESALFNCNMPKWKLTKAQQTMKNVCSVLVML